jgi:signal transduction histidine kinase
MFERGHEADSMWLVVSGMIQGYEEIGGHWVIVATTGPGQVTGMLPFSRMTHYPRHTVATEPSVVLRLPKSDFKEMLDVSPEMGQRLVAVMSDRVRGDVRLEQQNEKMMALGRLSAGLAHELNNPASAVRRAASILAEQRKRLPPLVTALVRHQVCDAGLDKLERLRAAAVERGGDHVLSELDRSEREDELADWLEAHGVPESWEVAGTFVESGVAVEDLVDLVPDVSEEALGAALAWVGAGLASDRMVWEIASASERIAELVASIKTYSHMDRSPEHKITDVRVGLDSTLTMLGHKIRKKGLSLERDYADDVPLIPANAGELNQVWTNIIDNAIDALEEGGRLRLRARRNDLWVEVEIADDGPGIPEETRGRIFEPFFTTKEVGVGTGLGLGIAQRIVKSHQGHIAVQSEPGHTVFSVRLPVEPTSHVKS